MTEAPSQRARELLASIKWRSADRDNMEFTATITYSQMDAIRALLSTAPAPIAGDEVALAARAFVEKIEAIHEDDKYRAVWELNHIRNGPYTGPQYASELARLKAAIEAIGAPVEQERDRGAPFGTGSRPTDQAASAGVLAVPASIPSADMVLVPRDAPLSMWDGLPRVIMLWLDYQRPTPRALFEHMRLSGYDVPAWMQEEGELKALDHVPSKGTRCVLIYRAMVENWVASAIEARRAETQSGSVEDESAVPSEETADAQPTPPKAIL